MSYWRGRPYWGWAAIVRVPGCVVQAIAGALVLGLMILIALIVTGVQALQTGLPR
jgi:hypothetical protein